ncbi:MAG: YccS family putative transporter [Neisseria sp.]|uniref:YccS family putative transporter n=1 Tax=Neisseria sp. TaxID=192066 RepID=UPI0026DC35DA|nr:YccS family putative transporter [Neisseria sp.]MDO4641452.1 YccS family putative transporter [Neisseria sp.]
MKFFIKTPPINAKVIATLPVFLSVCVASIAVRHFNLQQEAIPLVLGVIAGGLVDLDNRLTGRIKNIFFTMLAFAVSTLATQLTIGMPVIFVFAMTLLAFFFTFIGAAGVRYRTIAFGTLAVSVYTTLTYDPAQPLYVNSLMILCGTLLYSGITLLCHMIFPHRPVQENMAAAYAALADYLDAKADFFDPDKAWQIEQKQIRLAMSNSQVILAFNQCRSALFYRMRGQHRHPRTSRMLRYYFAAQDIHERASSSHVQYQEMAEKLKNSDLIFRFLRLLELQAQACRNVAAALRNNHAYHYDERLARSANGLAQSLAFFAQNHEETDVHPLQRLVANLHSVNLQLGNLENNPENEENSDATRIAHNETSGLRNILKTLSGQFNFQSATFRHAVRMAIIVFLCCALIGITHLHLGYWVLLTAVFVCQPNYSATQKRLKQRIIGTLAGVVVGSVMPYFTPSLETKLIVVVASTTLFYFFRTNKYSYSTFFITIQALTSFSIAGLDNISAIPWRLFDTVIGSLLAWAAVSYLWPDWHYLALNKTGIQAIQSDAGYLRRILEQLQNGGGDHVDYRIARRNAHERAAALSSTLSDMSGEPEKYGSVLQQGFNLLKINYSLIGYISALGAYRSQMHKNETDQAFLSIFFQAVQTLVYLLDNIGSLTKTELAEYMVQVHQMLQDLRQTEYHDEQSNVLWQQLAMIANLIEPCHAALSSVEAQFAEHQKAAA